MLPGVSLVRRKQINTLHIFNENVVEISKDTEYQVTFNQECGKTALIMRIFLPLDFPGKFVISQLIFLKVYS